MSSIVTFAYLRSLRKSRDMARYPMASPRLFRKKRSSLLRLRMHEFRYPQPTSQGFVGNFSSSLQTKGRCEKNLALQFARAIFHNRLPRPERIPSFKTASKTGRPLAGLRRDCLPGTSRANCAGK